MTDDHQFPLNILLLPDFRMAVPPCSDRFAMSLALALGLFVGLERERQHKDAGVRTFLLFALIGCQGIAW